MAGSFAGSFDNSGMNSKQLFAELGRNLPVGHEHAHLRVESIRGRRIVEALHALDELIHAQPDGGVRHLVELSELFQGPRHQQETLDEAKVFILEMREPRLDVAGPCRQSLVVRGLLESRGIGAVLRSHIAQSVHPFSVGDQGEVIVLVADRDARRARRILPSP